MKCLSNGCKNHSLLMTVELCHPCMQKIEKGSGNDFEPDWDTVKPYLDCIAELDKGCAECGVKASDGNALYCAKCSEPLREWVGLTDIEIAEAVGSPIDEVYLADFRKVEAKIKEKNND